MESNKNTINQIFQRFVQIVRLFNIFSRVHATLQPALSVGPSRLAFFGVYRRFRGLLLLPNHLVGQFHHCPCPPARD